MSENKSDAELSEILAKIEDLEKRQKSIATFRGLALVILACCIFYIYSTISGQVESFDQEEFVTELSKDSKVRFEGRFQDLADRTPKELEPIIAKHLKTEIDKRLPRLQERIFNLTKLNSGKINATLEKLVVDVINEVTDGILKDLPEAKLSKTLDNVEVLANKLIDNLEEQLLVNYEEINKNFVALYEVKEDFRVLAMENKLGEEEAKTLLVASMIDLLKYELLPTEAQKRL